MAEPDLEREFAYCDNIITYIIYSLNPIRQTSELKFWLNEKFYMQTWDLEVTTESNQ
jgi:hypothetical protein